jgi:predicted nucleic acid-binding Zn ribbon protein
MDTTLEQPHHADGYCVACGGPLQPNDRFCSRCGQPVQGVVESAFRRFQRQPVSLQAAAWILGWWFMFHFWIWSGTQWRWYWKATASAAVLIPTVPFAFA